MATRRLVLTSAPTIGTITDRIIATIRLVLAASALLIIVVDPEEPEHLRILVYFGLCIYTAYTAALYVLGTSRNAQTRLRVTGRWSHWIDVGWYTLLIALSGGSRSIFFYGFFFPVLVASFRWGSAAGLRVATAEAGLFAAVSLVAAEPTFEIDHFLVRPIYLLVMGYMIAYWGGSEIMHKRRLALLKEVMAVANPRFGVDRTIGWLMERLRSFYHADACLLVTRDPTTNDYALRRADCTDTERAARAEPIPVEIGQLLLSLPDERAIVYSGKPRLWELWRSDAGYHAHDVISGERIATGQHVSAAIRATLSADSFITVPLYYREQVLGRFYLTVHKRAFNETDAEFLLQVIEHVTPVIENIRLVDRLASDAAEEERRRIARDIHDSVIQPYIGLQIGLVGLHQKFQAGDIDVAGHLEDLITLTSDGIADLRGYVHGLKEAPEHEGSLAPAVHRFAKKFAEVTGIAVDVQAATDMRLNDRLAAEVFQMVAEGLSNVRRHTHATRATVDLARHNGHLILRLENTGANGFAPASFLPRSIMERATSLGGSARVECAAEHHTAVVVEIPL